MPMQATYLKDLGALVPGLAEKSAAAGPALGMQRQFTVRVGPTLLVATVTYKGTLFIAPCDGCFVKEIWGVSSVATATGVNTLAVANYDKSATATRNALSGTTVVADTYFPALVPIALPLSATLINLYMDEGDLLHYTLVCSATMNAGQGLSLTMVIVVPEIQPV